MKRLMIALMAMVMTIGVAGAQVRFGIKAGANFNKINYKNVEILDDPGNSCGFNAGVITEFTVPVIGICLDASLIYSRMNNASSTSYNKSKPSVLDGDMDWGKNFLEIPINLKYKLSIPMVASIIKPYIFTGPTFAFKLDKSILDRTYQAAWNVGIGVELINHLQVSGSYGFGINNVMKEVKILDGYLGDVEKIKANNNYWTVSAAWLF